MTILGTTEAWNGMSPCSGGDYKCDSLVNLDLTQPLTDLAEPLGDGVGDVVRDEAGDGAFSRSRMRNGRLNSSIFPGSTTNAEGVGFILAFVSMGSWISG